MNSGSQQKHLGDQDPTRPDLDSFTPNTTRVSATVEIEAESQAKAEQVLEALPSRVNELAFNGWPVYESDMEASGPPTDVPHFGHSITCYQDHPLYKSSRGPGLPENFPVEDKCGGVEFHLTKQHDTAVYRFFGPSVTVAGRPKHGQIAGAYELTIPVENDTDRTKHMRGPGTTAYDVQLHLNGMQVRKTISYGETNISPVNKADT